MRYVAIHDDAILMKTDGSTLYRFSKNGILTVGSSTTNVGTGNAIDTTNLMMFFPTDLDGTTTNCLEMAGMGRLTGSGLTSLECGLADTNGARWFFEAPILTGGDVVGCFVGVCYGVLSGTVTYMGIDYTKGEAFSLANDSGTLCTLTDCTGTFAVIPCVDECNANLTEWFKISILQTGNESTSYWSYNDGYVAMNSEDCTSPEFIGSID